MVSGISRAFYVLCVGYMSVKWFRLISYFILKKREKNQKFEREFTQFNRAVFAATYGISISLVLVHSIPIVMGFLKIFDQFCTDKIFLAAFYSILFIFDPMVSGTTAAGLIYLFTYLAWRK